MGGSALQGPGLVYNVIRLCYFAGQVTGGVGGVGRMFWYEVLGINILA